jgi:hypothetical protein
LIRVSISSLFFGSNRYRLTTAYMDFLPALSL